MNHIVKESVFRILDFIQKYTQRVYWQYSNSDPWREKSKLTISNSGVSIENV